MAMKTAQLMTATMEKPIVPMSANVMASPATPAASKPTA